MTNAQAQVIVIGGDPVMGRALEVLLQAAGYEVRFQTEPLADALDQLLVDSRLLLVAPGLSAESRKALADLVMRPATKIPVLQLLPANEEEVVNIQGADVALWPCTMEELQRRIRAALLDQD